MNSKLFMQFRAGGGSAHALGYIIVYITTRAQQMLFNFRADVQICYNFLKGLKLFYELINKL